jgi:uncharacterized phage-associated protein
MTHEVQLVANTFLDLADRDGLALDPMKIQKLVYVAHGWNLALRNVPLIRQAVQAWPYGPVIAELYDDFKRFRAQPITARAPIRVENDVLTSEDKDFIQSVWTQYKPYSAIQLSMFTHQAGYAWDMTMKSSGPYSAIPNELIRDEFIRRRQRTQP